MDESAPLAPGDPCAQNTPLPALLATEWAISGRKSEFGGPVYGVKRSFYCGANRLRFLDVQVTTASKAPGYISLPGICAGNDHCRGVR